MVPAIDGRHQRLLFFGPVLEDILNWWKENTTLNMKIEGNLHPLTLMAPAMAGHPMILFFGPIEGGASQEKLEDLRRQIRTRAKPKKELVWNLPKMRNEYKDDNILKTHKIASTARVWLSAAWFLFY